MSVSNNLINCFVLLLGVVACQAASSSSSFDGNSIRSAGLAGSVSADGYLTNFADVTVTVLSSVQKLLQDDISSLGGKSAELFCARNETEAFQLIVTNRSRSTLPDIEIYVSDWQGPAATRKPKVTLFREHYVKIDKPSYGLQSKPGWYPDALIPFADPYTGKPIAEGEYLANHAMVNARKNQGYWVDIRVDSDVPAGIYTCSILITSADQPISEVPLTLTVWDFALPKQRQFITWYYGFYDIHQYYGLSQAKGESYNSLMERHRDMAYAHGVYPVPQHIGAPRDPETGIVKFPASYITKMRDFINSYGKGVIEIPPSYYMFDTKKYVLFDETKFKNTIMSYDTFSREHPEFGQYVVYIDEPYLPERVVSVKQARIWMNEIPVTRIKMLLTGAKYAYDIEEPVIAKKCADIWVCYGPYVAEDGARDGYTLKELVDEFLADKNGDKIVWTNNANYYIDANLLTYRVFSWYGYTLGMTGGFGWQLTMPFSDSIGDAWVKSRTYIHPEAPERIYNGKGTHIYPGNNERVGFSGIGAPIASMRLKAWRQACEDYEYFKILENLTSKATVDSIISRINLGYGTYQSPTDYEAVREDVAEMIVEHKG